MSQKTILYLRTDQSNQELIAGGSVSHTVGVIEGFIHAGYNVVCGASTMFSVLNTLPLRELKLLKNPSWLSFLRWKLNCVVANFFFTVQLLPVFKQYAFAMIYQRYSVLNLTGVLLSKLKKVPLVLEYNGSEVWVEKNWVKKKWFKLISLIAWIEKKNLQAAHTIIVVSQVLKEELIERGIDTKKIIVNPNGVDVESYDPSKLERERQQIRQELNIENKFVFGFIGTFSYWHGIEILAAMIPEVIRKKSHSHFLLIGDGPLKPYLQDQLKRHGNVNDVTFTGLMPQQEAKKYLAACDAFLCPTQPNPDGTRFFGSPTKMFEYMSMAKPIVASRLEQLTELLSSSNHGEVGMLIEPNDTKGFVQAALTLIDLKDEELKKIGLAARRKAIAEYSWDKHVSNILIFIKEVHD